MTQCERESARTDSQDVGSEAATIERVRNSSLVECAGTDNVTRLKSSTEAVNIPRRGDMVGERSWRREARLERLVERPRSENAGMSSVRGVRTTPTESLRVPGQRQSSQG